MKKAREPTIDPATEPGDPSSAALNADAGVSPIYHGFVVIPETNCEGWILGEITDYLGNRSGDGFVVAPDGSRASLVWEVGAGEFEEILGPTPDHWGAYAIWFPRNMKTLDDLVFNFRSVLPLLQAAHGRASARAG